ncbi:hypothetical protein GCM10007301_56460 [Azorhizobium oxalatiphilum]|uniref:HAMP domain-containing protein n=1 Tax=Azorhizobium oxalatiphilum TaxID=980631 RepID=A0A917CHS2_9HYPH|nr:hypothetical protein [Azorhizobium oxalatiphilum]GGF89253.1 hypothetical protein GCM10007301_56460 [Azorhizobium oxalatiphilum]
MTFVSRLALVLAIALLATLLAVAAGAFVASQKVAAEIERARVSHLLGSLRGATEANLAIGLTLDQLSALQARIERETGADPSVQAIDVFNSQGRSVYSTDRGAVGEDVPAPWMAQIRSDGIWSVPGNGEIIYLTRFDNDLGFAGGVAVSVTDSEGVARNERLLFDLSGRTLAFIVAAIAVAIGLVLAFAAVMTSPFRRVTRILRGEENPQAPAPGLTQLSVQARRTWIRSEERIDAGLKQLEALDDSI